MQRSKHKKGIGRQIGRRMAIAAAAGLLMTPATVWAAEGNQSLSDQYNQIRTILGSGSRNSKSSTEVTVGPDTSVSSNANRNGVVMAMQADTGNNGLPSVQDVSLSEQYYSDYDMYEEGIAGQFYFYSNTGNGSITDESVYVDIPSNITYTVELDGQPIAYQSKERLTARGTYVFRLDVVYTSSEALSQQTEYRATFRFRIQDKPLKPTESGNEQSGSGSRAAETDTASSGTDIGSVLASQRITANDVRELIESGSVSLEDMADILGVQADSLSNYLGLGDLTEAGKSAWDKINNLLGDKREEESSTAGETETLTEETTETTGTAEEIQKEALSAAAAASGRGTGAGLVESWDEATGTYQETLLNGTSFHASVQNGATVNGSVSMLFPAENTLLVNVTRNGQAYEYAVGDEFQESGWYCMEVQDTASNYKESYAGKETPRFYFQIINDPVNDLSLLFAPMGEAVTEFTLNGQEQEFETSWVTFPDDGVYSFTYTTANGKEETVSITKDTRPPKIQVDLQRGSAVVNCNDEDLEYLVVYKDGAQVAPDGNGRISGSGTYQVYAADKAGNQSTQSFTLSFQISAATVIVILLVLLLIASLVVFVVRVRKGISMRS